MNEEVYDVILQTTGNFHASLETFQAHRPPDGDFHLNEQMWVGLLPNGISSTLVFDACDSPGWHHNPARQYGMRYAFCRRVKPDYDTYYKWDHDLVIGSAILLSRLIRPTTIGSSLTARLYFEGSELKTIVPGPTQSKCSHAFVVADHDYRDWLSVPELEQLRELLPRYIRTAPQRVRSGRRHLDDAFYAFFLDERFASLVTGLESLLKTSYNGLTEQFKLRASRLAELLGLELSGDDLHDIYAHRSDFVHGAIPKFEGLNLDADGQDTDSAQIHPAELHRYNKCEAVLRLALLRASTEPDFAALFASVEAIERAFPITPTKKRTEGKRLAVLASLSDEEFEAEYVRRYGTVHASQAFKKGGR